MAKKTSEIIIQFKDRPHLMFPLKSGSDIRSNHLALCIQPHEGFHQQIEVKVPDSDIEFRSVDMDFHYEEAFPRDSLPEAYETLLLNVLEGDASLFTRSDGIEAAWRVIDPILRFWETKSAPKLVFYPPGSWGPAESERLLKKIGRTWLHGCVDFHEK